MQSVLTYQLEHGEECVSGITVSVLCVCYNMIGMMPADQLIPGEDHCNGAR